MHNEGRDSGSRPSAGRQAWKTSRRKNEKGKSVGAEEDLEGRKQKAGYIGGCYAFPKARKHRGVDIRMASKSFMERWTRIEYIVITPCKLVLSSHKRVIEKQYSTMLNWSCIQLHPAKELVL